MAAWNADDAQDQNIVLDTSGYWRVFYKLAPPVVRTSSGVKELDSYCTTPPPPEGWMQPDFQDESWNRLPGAPLPSFRSEYALVSQLQVGFVDTDESSPCLSMICLRGKFKVTDPSKVKGLKLCLSYRGGVVAYLNGKQVARANLGAGDLTNDTLADDYPPEAYFKPDGSVLFSDRGEKGREIADRWLTRHRKLEDVAIPGSFLRPGVNVLAIEVHRAPYSEAFADKLKGQGDGNANPSRLWSTCGLVTARLQADAAEGLVPNVVRPKGFQVWNSNLLAEDFDVDFGDPNEPLQPVRIVGAGGGSFSGKVVVGSDRPVSGLKAAVSDLSAGGVKPIPASAVDVRYPLPTGGDAAAAGRYASAANFFDAFRDSPPPQLPVATRNRERGNWIRPGQPAFVFGAVQAIWITVNVPGDAAPAEYKGKLTVLADGVAPVEAPLELRVCGWKLPAPPQFDTLVDFMESPESVAMYYKVPLYSDQHFKLLAKSFEVLGRVGNWSVYLPLICQTNMGNEQSMIRWIRQPDGSYKYDFSAMEEYLDCAIAHMGKPRMVCLYIWDTRHGEGYQGDRASEPVPVSLLDEATGEVSVLPLPPYSSDEHARLWKPVADGIMQRLKVRGLEKAAMIGLPDDGAPDPRFVGTCAELFPGVPWMRHGHSQRNDISGQPIGYQCLVYTPRFPEDPSVSRSYGWKSKDNWSLFCRSQSVYPMLMCRMLGEMNIAGNQHGFGRIGLDFWPVLEDKKGNRTGTIQARFPQNSWENLDWMTKSFVPPGPDGAVPTVRLEMMREGLQECQARIFVEKAMTDPPLRAKLGDDLANSCQAVLDERTRDMLIGLDNHFNCGFGQRSTATAEWWGQPGQVGPLWYTLSGWQEQSEKLYLAAAEVAKALATK